MANYSTIQAAIDAGTTNMTVLRNHSRNDDSTTTYATGIDWFKFNNVVVSNIYSSGNSWLGFGANTEQLRVNRRDCAVWDEFSETGTIGHCRFYKFTWKGTSAYSSSYESVDSYQQYFDVFLFDTGQILLRFFKVPTSSFDGTKQLVCGSQTVNYSVTAGTPIEYTFTPSDADAGTGWSVGTDRPVIGYFKPSGNAILTLSNYVAGGGDSLFWIADIPENTSLNLYTKVNNGAWKQVRSNGGMIDGLPSGACTLQIKAEMTTTDNTKSPKLTGLSIRNSTDKKILVLTSAPPNFSSAIGNMTVNYDGLGGLSGLGGPTAPFSGAFTPTGLTWKGHQNDEEHINVSMSATAGTTLITYHSAQNDNEHLSVSFTGATVTLTDVHDL